MLALYNLINFSILSASCVNTMQPILSLTMDGLQTPINHLSYKFLPSIHPWYAVISHQCTTASWCDSSNNDLSGMNFILWCQILTFLINCHIFRIILTFKYVTVLIIQKVEIDIFIVLFVCRSNILRWVQTTSLVLVQSFSRKQLILCCLISKFRVY